jgi:hypothetical protein
MKSIKKGVVLSSLLLCLAHTSQPVKGIMTLGNLTAELRNYSLDWEQCNQNVNFTPPTNYFACSWYVNAGRNDLQVIDLVSDRNTSSSTGQLANQISYSVAMRFRPDGINSTTMPLGKYKMDVVLKGTDDYFASLDQVQGVFKQLKDQVPALKVYMLKSQSPVW